MIFVAKKCVEWRCYIVVCHDRLESACFFKHWWPYNERYSVIIQSIIKNQTWWVVACYHENGVVEIRQFFILIDEIFDTVIRVKHCAETLLVFVVLHCFLRRHLGNYCITFWRILLLFFLVFDVKSLVVGDCCNHTKQRRIKFLDFFNASLEHDMVEIAPPVAEGLVGSWAVFIVKIWHIVNVLSDEIFRDAVKTEVATVECIGLVAVRL